MTHGQRHWWQLRGRGDSDPTSSTGAESRYVPESQELNSALDLIAHILRLLGEVPVLPDTPAASELRDSQTERGASR
jgi:hypothetical protein